MLLYGHPEDIRVGILSAVGLLPNLVQSAAPCELQARRRRMKCSAELEVGLFCAASGTYNNRRLGRLTACTPRSRCQVGGMHIYPLRCETSHCAPQLQTKAWYKGSSHQRSISTLPSAYIQWFHTAAVRCSDEVWAPAQFFSCSCNQLHDKQRRALPSCPVTQGKLVSSISE